MENLQPPGAGLPKIELMIAKGLFSLKSMLTSDDKALATFEREMKTLLNLVDDADLIDIEQPVLIGRLTGLEDSSRNWSVLMVLEHLRLVNNDILKVIDALKSGVVPRGDLAIEFYKPDPDVGTDVIQRFKESSLGFLDAMRAHGRLQTRATYAHPWFGQLDGHRWGVLAAMHMQIHRRQAQQITAKQGVV
jgi:hypothetical protein